MHEEFGKKPRKAAPHFSFGWKEMLRRYGDASMLEKSGGSFSKVGPFRLPCLLSDGKTITEFQLFFYESGDRSCFVLTKGRFSSEDNVLVRIHSACSFAHLFHSLRCDCKEQLDKSLLEVGKKGGVIIYALDHEGRGVGFKNHVKAYMKQDQGFDTVDSYLKLGLRVDSRDYSLCASILNDLKVKKILLLTNNPRKIEALQKRGFEVKRVAISPTLSKFNESQLRVKREKLGHLI